MIVVMVVAHKAKRDSRHVILRELPLHLLQLLQCFINVICYRPMCNNVSSVLNTKVVLAQGPTDQSRATIQKVAEENSITENDGILHSPPDTKKLNVFSWILQTAVCGTG